MSIESGMKTLFSDLCMRQSWRAPGSESREKIAASVVKTWPIRGTSGTKGDEPGVPAASMMVMGGSKLDYS